MTPDDDYIATAIHTAVWSGFHDEAAVGELIDAIITSGDADVDEETLRALAVSEFAAKAEAERAWPATTECDHLDAAFADMNEAGLVALQIAGTTMGDAHSDVAEALAERGPEGIAGYCFYHEQDLERAVAGNGLLLAFGDLDDTPDGKRAVGATIVAILAKHRLRPVWNGDPEARIELPDIIWLRRYGG